MRQLIYEAKLLKNCLAAGLYDKAYESAQNIEDELTRMEIKKGHRLWDRLKGGQNN